MQGQELVPRPAMVGDPCRHGRRRLLGRGQTLMRRAKILDCTHQEHPCVQGQGVTCQRPAAACQRCEALPECRVEPLNVRRIAHPIPLRSVSERLHACRRAIDQAAVGLDHTPPFVALDDWGDQDIAPRTPPGPSALARVPRIAKGGPHGPDRPLPGRCGPQGGERWSTTRCQSGRAPCKKTGRLQQCLTLENSAAVLP